MTGDEKPSTVMARKACPREGGERAIQAMKDVRRLDGVLANAGIEPDHDR